MKVINILLIIIFTLAVILGIKVYNTNSKPKYSITEVKNILDKANGIKNYECELDLEYNGFEYYKRKDNIICLKNDTNLHIRDFDSKIDYTISESGKTYLETELNMDKVTTSNRYTGNFTGDEITLMGESIVKVDKEKDCLKIKTKDKNQETTIFWINIDTGLIIKTKSHEGDIREYKYKFNTVTNDDVKPDLSGYTKIEEGF